MSPVPSSLNISRRSADVRSQLSSDDNAIDDSFPHENGMHLASTISRPYGGHDHEVTRTTTVDDGSRRKVAEAFIKIGNVLGTAARDWLDDSEFKRGRALDFPEVPGEVGRNPDLSRIRSQYNQRRDSAGNVTPIPQSRSRAESFLSVNSGYGAEDSPTARRAGSPRPSQSSFASPTIQQRPHANSVPMGRTISAPHHLNSTMSGPARTTPVRSSTLEVPSTVYHGHRHTQSASSTSPLGISRNIGHSPLGITTTAEPETASSSNGVPSINTPATPSSSNTVPK